MANGQVHKIWKERAALSALLVAASAALTTIPSWLLVLTTNRGHSAAEAGFVISTFSLSIPVGILTAVALLSRVGTRSLIGCGSALSGAAFLVVALIEASLVSLPAMALAGLGCGAMMSAINVRGATLPNPVRTFALLAGTATLASAVLFAVGPQSSALFGPSAIFYTFAVLNVTGALISLAFLAHVRAAGTIETIASEVSGAPSRSAAIAILCAQLFSMVANASIWSFAGAIALGTGMTEREAGRSLAIATAISVLAPILAAVCKIQDRRRLWFAALLPFPAGLAALSLGHASTPVAFLTSAIILCFFVILLQPFQSANLAYVDDSKRFVAVAPLAVMVGAAFGPGVAGLVFDAHGASKLALISAAFFLFSSAALTIAALVAAQQAHIDGSSL